MTPNHRKRPRDASKDEDDRDGRPAKRPTTVGPVAQATINADQVLPKLPRDAYDVGWVSALHLEMAAAIAMLDLRHEAHAKKEDDSNVYVFGSIGLHNIVIACLPSGEYGTVKAAVVANNMRSSFPSIRIGLMVGIGGGVPGKVDIRLGDVVVSNPTGDSPGVVQYDFGKALNNGRFERIGSLNKPPPFVLAAVTTLRAKHETQPSQIPSILDDMKQRNPSMVEYTHQFVDEDLLFESSYEHSGENCDNCDRSKLVPRDPRATNDPSMHYGIIGSANLLMKDAKRRDQLAKDHGLICFEMEAAGLMDNFPCLVIRGICDYSDSHKQKRWQKYAAATAAAYAKELLCLTPSQENLAIHTQSEARDLDSPQTKRKEILNSLKFDQIGKRHANIKANHAKTCEWLLHHAEYIAWKDSKKYKQHHGFLWMRGKPGAGKSTIMKFALKCAAGRKISFFFNARGESLEKTTLGMYRSLLYQLLKALPDLQVLLDTTIISPSDQQGIIAWDLETTKVLFRRAIQNLGTQPLTCFIDALDECEEAEVRELVEVFEDLGQYAVQNDIRFYAFLSSRHYPYIDVQYGQNLILEDQDGHANDLAKYVRTKLKAGTGHQSDEIIAEILRKASGVFMWVVLVVDILNKEYLRGRLFAVQGRLKEIPSELGDLFKDILTRDQENKDDLLLCIQWLLYSKRPLKREEYYFAMTSGLEPSALEAWDPSRIQIDAMDRLVLSSSKGLAETTNSHDKTVQFIHESVRDFLLKDNGIRHVWPNTGANFEAQSHNKLRDCCHEYSTRVDISEYLPQDEFLLHLYKNKSIAFKDTVERGFPFLEYATNHVLYHSNAAAKSVPQTHFIQTFPFKHWDQWIQRRNLFEPYRSRRQNPDSTNLLYIVAERGLAELVKEWLRLYGNADIRGGRHGYSLLAALKEGHDGIARLLLESFGIGVRPASINCTDKQGRTPLYFVAERGQIDIAEMLFSRGARADLVPDKVSYSPLYRAFEKRQVAVFTLILRKRLSLRSSGRHSSIPQSAPLVSEYKDTVAVLDKAIEIGYLSPAQILLDAGISIDTKCATTLLFSAIRCKREASAVFLLDNGANINQKEQSTACYPIHCAILAEDVALLELLIRRGSDLEVQNVRGLRPLHLACTKGSSVMTRLLIREDVEVQAKDVDGNTPMSLAVSADSLACVDLLLQHDREKTRGKP